MVARKAAELKLNRLSRSMAVLAAFRRLTLSIPMCTTKRRR